ncbi:MAG: hypothetical protein ABFD46_10135 [Armatimonadota bacterium]
MKKFGLALFSIVVIALAAGYFVVNRNTGSDQDQIFTLIDRGRQSVESKSLDSAMSCVSKNCKDEGVMNYDRIKLLISEAFRSESKYEATVDTPAIEMEGTGKARAKAHVTVFAVRSDAKQEVFSGDMTFLLTKERTRKYLIFPTHEWKVSGVEGLGRIFDLL